MAQTAELEERFHDKYLRDIFSSASESMRDTEMREASVALSALLMQSDPNSKDAAFSLQMLLAAAKHWNEGANVLARVRPAEKIDLEAFLQEWDSTISSIGYENLIKNWYQKTISKTDDDWSSFAAELPLERFVADVDEDGKMGDEAQEYLLDAFARAEEKILERKYKRYRSWKHIWINWRNHERFAQDDASDGPTSSQE